ncbi:golgin-45-like isoform X2 [Varroa destructor]|nr:golgin-45-like isoform X2 [Varroa destructor]XP_022673159.1 golgin-45-like isoform X2 [Varroa destructor]XP_022673166.1 golgin-45-like isoform X2 [Varroa destructor]
MESPMKAACEVPMPVSTHRAPRFVPKEPYKAAVGLSKREHERNKLLRHVDQLERKLETLHEQYKIQVDVNADLKKLLVASLGEDMQERVQFLTEDKNRLASEIAFYTQKLQKDLGHIDELNIEVDVWRTKYLATSLLVTELATVKAELMKKCDDFEKAVEGSRKERAEITDKIFKAYNILREVHFQVELQSCPKRRPRDLVECSHWVLQLASGIAANFKLTVPVTNEVLDQTLSEKTCDIALNQYRNLTSVMAARACVQVDQDTQEDMVRTTGVPTSFGCQKCRGTMVHV